MRTEEQKNKFKLIPKKEAMRGVTPTKMGATFEKLSRGALEG
jgi:hypothetical protein